MPVLRRTAGVESRVVAVAVTLITPRLELRPFTAADLDAAHAMWTAPPMRRYLWDDTIIGRDVAAGVLRASRDDFATRGFGLWRLHERRSDALIGFCGCRTAGGTEPELMYGILPEWWGQGLAVDASTAVLDHVFGTLHHAAVIAATDPPNLASVRVLEKLGMTFERRATLNGLDTLFYRLTRAAWRQRRDPSAHASAGDDER